MIIAQELAKALLNKANEVAIANSYTLIPQGQQYSPGIDETYVMESCLFGDNTTIGYANNSKDIQFGVYQIAIYTPKTQEGYRWLGLSIADKFSEAFAMGAQLSSGGQMVEILKASVTSPTLSSTHMTHILSVRFNVIN